MAKSFLWRPAHRHTGFSTACQTCIACISDFAISIIFGERHLAVLYLPDFIVRSPCSELSFLELFSFVAVNSYLATRAGADQDAHRQRHPRRRSYAGARRGRPGSVCARALAPHAGRRPVSGYPGCTPTGPIVQQRCPREPSRLTLCHDGEKSSCRGDLARRCDCIV
jgi:hypothetical protein